MSYGPWIILYFVFNFVIFFTYWWGETHSKQGGINKKQFLALLAIVGFTGVFIVLWSIISLLKREDGKAE